MTEAPVLRKAVPQAQSTASNHTQMTSRQPYISEPIASKHVCFYKSGDAQFSGLPVVLNSRTFRTFDALLDSLSKRVPLPFGVRNITTPHGHTAVRSLDQLHHGQSYICSDRRTVKPVDLERARRKLPPWYHTRPVSAGRLALQARGLAARRTRGAGRNEHAALLHMPKRLVMFRNGEPEVKHTLMLQKRTTHSFEALLEHMSEVMNFPVLKLHTPDGRMVEGLPALTLCSGVLVAAGREPFKKRSYDVQKTTPPTWLPAKRVGRLHPIERKKKSRSTKSRPFSPSSERYFVDQIHNSIAGSMCDFPSNPAGSLEIESGHPLKSVAETDMITCVDGEGEGDTHVPSEDDIEKSFRVNQDGSMTVEMKVRLTIKEEETIHWTTTVSRSSVTNQVKEVSDSSPDLDAHLPENLPPLDDPVTTEVSESHPKVNSHSWPEKDCEEDEQSELNGCAASMEIDQPSSPLKQSPGMHKVQQTQASTDSIRTVTDTEIQENSSYSYKEQLDNGEITEKYCMVQCRRPVPKPRGNLPSEMNTTTRLQSNSYRASEVLQLQENGKEVRETVLHIYEKQTCQENLSGNMQLGLQDFGVSPDGSPYGHPSSSGTVSPATSDKTFHSSSADMEPETPAIHKRQSIGNELSRTHKPYTSTYKANTATTQRAQEPKTLLQNASVSRRISTPGTILKKKPVRVIVKKNYLFNTANQERKQKHNKADILKEIKKIRADLISQTEAMKIKEDIRVKAVQKLLKRRNYAGSKSVALKHQREQIECSASLKTEHPNLNLLHASLSKGPLTRQTSMHVDSGSQGQTQEVSQSMSLPALHISSSLKNQYVELWLKKSQPELSPHLDKEPLTTTNPQKTTFHNGSEQEPSKEDPETVEDGKDGDRGHKDSVLNPDTVIRTTVSTSCSSINATPQSSFYNEHLPRNTSLGTLSGHELTPLPRKLSLKESSYPLSSTVQKNLSATGSPLKKAEKVFLKETQSPINTLQNTALPSQPSLETIPKNNTMVKASLFTNQLVEKTQFKLADKKRTLIPPSQMINTAQDKTQVNNDKTTKTRENRKQISELKTETSSYDTENCTSLTKSHDIQTKPPSKQIDVQAEKFYTVKMSVRPDMKPVLDQLCYSLQSLREITQPCLKSSKTVPDFFAHLASAFGSSSRVLLAFLSIMTLKDGLKHLHARCQAGRDPSCSEAMLMLQSLKELARIEDAEQLKQRLTDLHTSASVQLLQSWRGFQELSNKAKSHSITADTSVIESHHRSNSEAEEQAIQALMGELGVPERVREKLAAISNIDEYTTCSQMENIEKVSDSLPEVKVNGFSEHHSGENMAGFSNSVLEDYVNLYVNSVIDKAVNAHLQESSMSQISRADSPHRHKKDLRGENLYHINRTETHNSSPDSDICEDKPSSESCYGMEMHRELDLKRTEVEEMKEVRHKRQKDKTGKKKDEEMRVERQRGIDRMEASGTMEENNSAVSLEEVMRKVATEEIDKVGAAKVDSKLSPVSCKGRLTSYGEEQFNEEGEYENCDELLCFPEERSFNKVENLAVKYSMPNYGAEQACAKEEISENWQTRSKSQILQTQVQLHNNTTDIGLPEQQDIPHVIHIGPNVEVDEIQHSNTHQDFCMENMTCSEDDHVIIEAPECYTIYQENFVELPEEVSEYEEKDLMEERTNSVAKLISSLEDQKRSVEKRPYNTDQMSGEKTLNHINVTNVETPKITRATYSTTMDPLSSSLTFSYDIQRDPERNIQINRVKSIREMFLAKSSTDTQHKLTSQSSDLSEYQPESSDSTEHSSTSPEVSKEEEDTCRLAIAKGYVKRTIERLYGKGFKETSSEEKIPPSTHKAKKREGLRGTNVTSLASIHEARTNAISDLSYFNATSSMDGFNDPTRCLNTWVGPKDAVLIDKGRWLLRGNQTSPKSSPEPEDKPKNVIEKVAMAESEQDSEKEDVPYSLFGPMTPDKVHPFTEQGEPTGSTGTTFAYFHLPNASDSETETDKPDTGKNETENTMTPLTESNKCWTEKHGILTVFSLPDIKKANKVQPLIETTPPVVTQPTKGKSVQSEVAKHSVEPDALEILYMFCGQHCPLL